MEHPHKRTTIEGMNAIFPNLIVLGIPEIKTITGWSESTIHRKLDIRGGHTTKAALADQLCKIFG